MSWLLDTNVLSEALRPRPDRYVTDWLAATAESELFVSAITIAEIKRGIVLLPDSARRRFLLSWLQKDLVAQFEDRILPVNYEVASIWGSLVGGQELKGRSLSVLDSFIAATAMAHELTLSTRNIADFTGLGVDLFNPWDR